MSIPFETCHTDAMQGYSEEKWQTMTLAEQLGNVGSDFERALKWKKADNQPMFTNAMRRTLEQLDMTLTDNRHHGIRRREIARVREAVCTDLLSASTDAVSSEWLTKYFLSMAMLARKNRS